MRNLLNIRKSVIFTAKNDLRSPVVTIEFEFIQTLMILSYQIKL